MPSFAHLPRTVATKYSVQLLFTQQQNSPSDSSNSKQPGPSQSVLLGTHLSDVNHPFYGRKTGLIKDLSGGEISSDSSIGSRGTKLTEVLDQLYSSSSSSESDSDVTVDAKRKAEAAAEKEKKNSEISDSSQFQCVSSFLPAVTMQQAGVSGPKSNENSSSGSSGSSLLAIQNHARSFCGMLSLMSYAEADSSSSNSVGKTVSNKLNSSNTVTRSAASDWRNSSYSNLFRTLPDELKIDLHDSSPSNADLVTGFPGFPDPAASRHEKFEFQKTEVVTGKEIAPLVLSEAGTFASEAVEHITSNLNPLPRKTLKLHHRATLEFFEVTDPGVRYLEYVFVVELPANLLAVEGGSDLSEISESGGKGSNTKSSKGARKNLKTNSKKKNGRKSTTNTLTTASPTVTESEQPISTDSEPTVSTPPLPPRYVGFRMALPISNPLRNHARRRSRVVSCSAGSR